MLTVAGTMVAACAYPDFQFGPGDATTSTSAATGGGGQAGGTTTTLTTTTAGEGGAGGVLPTDCTLFSTGECGPGRKCSIVDPVTGEAGCVDAGTHPPWSKCDVDTDCGEGFFCPEVWGTCHPICQDSSDCGGMPRQCLPTFTADGPIPNFGVCTANCHPVTGLPCSSDRGVVNCVPRNGGLLDCAASGGVMFGQSCETSNDCRLGLVCLDGTNACTFWCAPPDFTENGICPGDAPYCDPTDPDVTHEGITYGVCAAF